MTIEHQPRFSWYNVARKEIGVKELRGIADNPRVIEYHSATTLRATDDEIPWCSSFVNWCMRQAGYTPTASAAARSWLSWGHEIDVPVKGCIVVFTRTGGGHVGFFEELNEGIVRCLGGNQDDAVNVKPFPVSRVLGYFVPSKMTIEDETTYSVLRALV